MSILSDEEKYEIAQQCSGIGIAPYSLINAIEQATIDRLIEKAEKDSKHATVMFPIGDMSPRKALIWLKRIREGL